MKFKVGILISVLFVIYQYHLKSKSYYFQKALKLSNDISTVFPQVVLKDIEETVSDIQWDTMLVTLNSILDPVHFENLPTLFSIDTATLVGRVADSRKSRFNEYEENTLKELQTFMDDMLGLVVRNASSRLLEEFTSYTSDSESLVVFQNNLSVVQASTLSTIPSVLTKSCGARFSKLRGIFDKALEWKLITYARFLSHLIRTRAELNPIVQVDVWIELETQQVLGFSGHINGYLNASYLEAFADNYDAFKDDLYQVMSQEARVYGDLLAHFSEQFPNLENILSQQYGRLYLLRVEAIEADIVLEDSQKRILKSFAMKTKNESENRTVEFEAPSFVEVESTFSIYFSRLMDKIRVVVLVAYLEYRSICLRAQATGQQATIVNFYQMRAALNRAFFFEYAKDRSFDITSTKADFESDFLNAMANTESIMLSLVDMSKVILLYDRLRSFMLSRVAFFFLDDLILSSFMRGLVTSVHDSYADIIAQHTQAGIDMEFTEQRTFTTLIVTTVFERFLGEVEFSYVVDLVYESRSSIIGELVEKVGLCYDEFNNVHDDLVLGSLKPFTFEHFESLTESFLTGDQINYIAMRQHVVDATNAVATTTLEETRVTYRSLIDSLFENVYGFIASLSSDLTLVAENTERQSVERVDSLKETVNVIIGAMSSYSHTLKESTKVSLENILGTTLQDLEDAQSTRLQNYFDTKIQLIKDDFATSLATDITALWEEHIGKIEGVMLELSGKARQLFRESIDTYLENEKKFRDDIVSVSESALSELRDEILREYNIVSYSARESALKEDMRQAIRSSAASVIADRDQFTFNLSSSWAGSFSSFRAEYLAEADSAKSAFFMDLRNVINEGKLSAIEIMGEVEDFLNTLEGEFFDETNSSFEGIIDSVIASSDNDLPETLDMFSMITTPGIMDLTVSPEIPADAFIRGYRDPDEDTLYDDEGNILPEVDLPSGLTTTELVFLFLDFDDWLQGRIEELVLDVQISMEGELIQNTCRDDKPPCREGWVEYVNSPWGVPCCRFDPESQGFLSWEVAGMLLLELCLCLLLDLEDIVKGIAGELKGVYNMGKKGFAASVKYSRSGQKVMLKSIAKYAGKTPARMTKAIKMSARMGKTLANKASQMGVKMGTRAASKAAAKAAVMGTKMLAKLSLGPLFIAIQVFDFISFILDMWDPAGYNNQQSAAMLRLERDEIEKYWSVELKNMGFDHPILADPFFSMSLEEKDQLYLTVEEEWIADKFSAYLLANEERFETMTDFETDLEVFAKYDDLYLELDQDPNIIETLVAEKLDNVFLQDISVRQSHKNPYTEGGSQYTRTHTIRNVNSSGILEIVLNETGVEAFNSFMRKKADFLNSFKYNPMYRYVKRKHSYVLTKNSAVSKFLREGTKCDIQVIQKAGTYSHPSYPYYTYEVLKDCVEKPYPLLIPTPTGSIAFADAISNQNNTNPLITAQNNAFAQEIRDNVEEGWSLTLVDPEEEFWVQYDPDKSLSDLLDRSTYQKSHEDQAKESQFQYNMTVDSLIGVKLDEQGIVTPVSDIKVAYLATLPENWETIGGQEVFKYPLTDEIDDTEKLFFTRETIPVVPPELSYLNLRAEIEATVEAEYSTIFDDNQFLIGQAYEEAHEKEQERLQNKADEQGVSVDQIISDESVEGRSSEPLNPEFAVFLNGYGQSSPLYAISQDCQNMGKGVSYDKKHGLCNFTKEYCDRYGVDFFFNQELGVYDCEKGLGLTVAEYIFGTTMARSAKRGYKYLTNDGDPDPFAPNAHLGSSRLGSSGSSKIGSCHKVLGLQKVAGGVPVKRVQNGDNLNYVDTSTALDVIGKIGLSGF